MKTSICKKCDKVSMITDEEFILRKIFGEDHTCDECSGASNMSYLDFVKRNEDANG